MNMHRVFLLMALVLVGCGDRHASTRTVDDFRFLKFGMTMREVTNRIGVPDRHAGSGVLRWEYDLADGSRFVIFPELPRWTNAIDFGTWPVTYFGQRKGTNWLWERSEKGK
jgi:hypothetical protein